jgi:ATP-binding cassette, subfamily A (ABC1), member 3
MAEGSLKCLGSAQHLKTRFGQGFQIEIKLNEPADNDEDILEILQTIQHFEIAQTTSDDLHGSNASPSAVASSGRDKFFNLEQAKALADQLSSDGFLSSKISETDLAGHLIYKYATSDAGVEAMELAAFFATELRLQKLIAFFESNYEDFEIREQQGTRIRIEVPFNGIKISDLFSSIENEKDLLSIDDYGISQTTLEQVFNMHAAAAEAKKEGTDDH